MNTDRIETQNVRSRLDAFIQEHGPWSGHNIHLGDGVYTISAELLGDEYKLRRMVQIIADTAGKPFRELRILDLACLEGLYGIEFARHGASVVVNDIRPENLEKVRFAKEVLGLLNLEIRQDDVRNLNVEKYGIFDVVFCSGILYHLNDEDVFRLLENIGRCSKRLAIIDTQVSLRTMVARTFNGHTYYGRWYLEPPVQQDQAANGERSRWSSFGNQQSFWLTAASLVNFMSSAGFTTVFECQYPIEIYNLADRVTLVALKGDPQPVFSAPLLSQADDALVPEQRFLADVLLPRLKSPALQRLVPVSARKLMKRLLGWVR